MARSRLVKFVETTASTARLFEVVVRTRVGHLEGLTFERLTEIERLDGRRLAESRTLWCPIDPRSGRPRRVSEALRALFSSP